MFVDKNELDIRSRRNITYDIRFPKIVCLCGSSKFKETFDYASQVFTYHGWIVVTMTFFTHYEVECLNHNLKLDVENWMKVGNREYVEKFVAHKEKLDELHKRKIDLATHVFIIDKDEYIGQSTKSEIEYAISKKKPVGYWSKNVLSLAQPITEQFFE